MNGIELSPWVWLLVNGVTCVGIAVWLYIDVRRWLESLK